MPAGYFVDGKLTYKPLVSVVTEFADRTGLGPAAKTLAVVGEFPFLEKSVPYVFLSRDAFLGAVPANATMRELASMIYAPSTSAPFAGSPGAVILVNAKPCNQASGYLKDADDANSLKIIPSVWGAQGNATTVSITGGGDGDLNEYTIVVANRGVTETFAVDKGLGVFNLSYAHPIDDLVSGTAYGFSNTGAGSGAGQGGAATLTLEKSSDNIELSFTRTLTEHCLKATSAEKSWIPNGPVNGFLTIVKPAAVQTLPAGNLVVHVFGADHNGNPVELPITFTNAEIVGAGAVTKTTNSVSRVDYVSIVGVGWDGSLTISGASATIGAEYGHDFVSEAINYLNTLTGFSASSDSFRPGTIQVAALDAKAPSSADYTLNASKALLVEAFGTYSTLVTVESLNTEAADLSADIQLQMTGGYEISPQISDWQSAFSALRTSPVTVLFPYTTDDAVHRTAFDHAKFMWGKGQRELQVVLSPANDLSLSSLVTLRRGYADYRVTVLPHKVRVTKWTGGASDYQTKYLGLIFAAMQCASTEVGLPLGGSRPNVLAFSGHSSILGPDAADTLIANGFTPLEDVGDGIKIVRWVTTFGASNDPTRTEGSAVESIAFSNIGVREALKPLLNQKATADMTSKIRNAVTFELTRQLGLSILRTWLPETLQVVETPTAYTVKYTIAPILPVNNIAVTSVAIAFPIA
jgi:hypothetical protein